MTRIILPFAALLTGLLIVSCDDDTDAVVKHGSAQFERSELSLAENSEKTTISIAFNRQADENGEAVVQVSSSNVEGFVFNPAIVDGVIKLPFSKGQTKITFDVTSIDNDVLDGDKTLDFMITYLSPGYDIGITRTLSTVWVDDESPAKVNFEVDESQGRENNNAALPVKITFSHAAKADGFVDIAVESVDAFYGVHYTTVPAASNGVIKLQVEPGKTEAVFHVVPVDNVLYHEERTISYTILYAYGGLEKGAILRHELRIKDDELEGTAKGYEVVGGSWRLKKRYEYNSNGTISKIYWDKYTPAHSEGVDTYVYDMGGKLEKIIQSPVNERVYLREGDRIVRSEEYANGVLKQYTLYGYDDAGNVAEAAVHYRQPDGTLELGFIFVYLYYQDHNVYKSLTYQPVEGAEDPVLISTKTYDNYIDVENPFPMVEILPDQKAQHKLPTSYRLEENGHDITYQFTYQISDEGRPLSRTATSSSSGSETAQYEYY